MSDFFDFNRTPPSSSGRQSQIAARKRKADADTASRRRKQYADIQARDHQRQEEIKKRGR